LWVFLKFQKSPLTVSLAYSTSWSVFKTLGKNLDHFIDKSKTQKAALACVLLESFEKFLVNPYYEPLLWFMIIVVTWALISLPEMQFSSCTLGLWEIHFKQTSYLCPCYNHKIKTHSSVSWDTRSWHATPMSCKQEEQECNFHLYVAPWPFDETKFICGGNAGQYHHLTF